MKLDFTKPWWQRRLGWKRLIFVYIMAEWASHIVRRIFPDANIHYDFFGFPSSANTTGLIAGLVVIVWLVWLGANVQ